MAQQRPSFRCSLAPASLAAIASALLVACGGGQEGGSEGTSTGGVVAVESNARAQISASIPPAPTPGEILHDDAATLRPLTDEALWVYRGVRFSGGQEAQFGSFRQVTKSASGFQERVSSPLANENRIRTLTLATGQITAEDPRILATGLNAVVAVELRSPIRQGDQINIVEQKGVALTEDLDGDQKLDTMDVAVWSRVIGREEVDLPELERSLRAVRVDVTAVSQLHMSSRAQAEAATQVTESTWYAPGIGIVRHTRTAPSTTGTGPVEMDERLQMWDGISTGIGLLPSTPVSITGGSPSVGPWLETPYAAVRNGNQVFLLSAKGGTPDRGLSLSVLNARGRVEHSVDHSNLGFSAAAQPQLLPLGDGVATVRTEAGVLLYPLQLENLKLMRFDARGQRVGKDIWLVDGALPGSLQAASDGNTVWVAWADEGASPGSRRLMLQAFDASGNFKSPAYALDTRSGGTDFSKPTVAAYPGKVLVTWRVQAAQRDEVRQALLSAGAQPVVATLAAGLPRQAAGDRGPQPLLTDSLAALIWFSPLEAAGLTSVTAPRAVALDEQAQPRRATVGAIDQELLALPAGSVQSASRMAMAAEAKRMLWAAAGSARLRGESEAEDRMLAFATVDAGDAALSAAKPQPHRFRDSSPAGSWTGSVQALQHIVPMDDRWMIIGHDGRHATVAVLHKR